MEYLPDELLVHIAAFCTRPMLRPVSRRMLSVVGTPDDQEFILLIRFCRSSLAPLSGYCFPSLPSMKRVTAKKIFGTLVSKRSILYGVESSLVPLVLIPTLESLYRENGAWEIKFFSDVLQAGKTEADKKVKQLSEFQKKLLCIFE